MTVLVVEDDPDQLTMRCLLLERVGFTTLAANDPQTALRLALANNPHCALMDLRLPAESDGLQLLGDLKTQLPKMRVIVVTGGRIDRLRQLPQMQLADEIWAKPLSSAAMLESLQRMAANELA